MRVIFTGQTGIGKKAIVRRLGEFCLKEAGKRADLENVSSRRYLRVFHLEDEIEEVNKVRFVSSLDSSLGFIRDEQWEKAFQYVLDELKTEDPEHCFLDFHLLTMRNSSTLSSVNIEQIREFKPDMFVTIIDDVQAIWKKINLREEQVPTRSSFSLREILSWRTSDITSTDLIAKALSTKQNEVKNLVCASLHPIDTLYKLIFQSAHSLVAYCAFPITETRNDPRKVSEINDFIEELERIFIAFSPVTIDEKVIELKHAATMRDNPSVQTITLVEDDRWPIPPGKERLRQNVRADYPIELPCVEVEECRQPILSHIKARDYRLIDQSDCIVAYRPSFGQTYSRGVSAELTYAAQTMKDRFIFDPPEDRLTESSPFAEQGIVLSSRDELIDTLRNYEKEVKGS